MKTYLRSLYARIALSSLALIREDWRKCSCARIVMFLSRIKKADPEMWNYIADKVENSK